ncbi:get complex subunit get1 [Gigaspora margarita]|uniref:Get complex subunit get1 n=2 Tax=Gigaspora margarita TaxID=4874 RepID=A0A8H4EFE0_GIGMA|nr:get complex subunit get1 [Gigaspora margarita]
MALAFFIAMIVLLTELMLWVGYSQIASLAYIVYLNIFKKEDLVNQRKIKRAILTVRQELARTSPQDEFANWARLKRKLDKKVNELEKITASFGYLKTSFEVKFTSFLWVASNGIQIILMLYFLSTPVFYLPQGWFSPVTWIFSMPFSPSGSVSVGFWFLACRKMVKKVMVTYKDSVPLYYYYAPDSVKRLVTIVHQWCNARVRIYLPVVIAWSKTMLQWCNANIRTHSPIIIDRMKLQVQKIYALILEVIKSTQSSAVNEQSKSSVDATTGTN